MLDTFFVEWMETLNMHGARKQKTKILNILLGGEKRPPEIRLRSQATFKRLSSITIGSAGLIFKNCQVLSLIICCSSQKFSQLRTSLGVTAEYPATIV